MAHGRMLNKSITLSMKFDALPNDTARLMATWIISHLDMNGVFYGDATTVKSLIFPLRSDITDDQVETYLQAMASKDVDLIVLFRHGKRRWQFWPGFADNQPGLRRERERTDFPTPDMGQIDNESPKAVSQSADILSSTCRQTVVTKTAEVKLTEVNITVESQTEMARCARSETLEESGESEIPLLGAGITMEFTRTTQDDVNALVAKTKQDPSSLLLWKVKGDETEVQINKLRVPETDRQAMLEFHRVMPYVTFQKHPWRVKAPELWAAYKGDLQLLELAAKLVKEKGLSCPHPGSLIWAVDKVKQDLVEENTRKAQQGEYDEIYNPETRTVTLVRK